MPPEWISVPTTGTPVTGMGSRPEIGEESVGAGQSLYWFMKVTNKSLTREIELTHVFAGAKDDELLTWSEPLPARLKPDQTWEGLAECREAGSRLERRTVRPGPDLRKGEADQVAQEQARTPERAGRPALRVDIPPPRDLRHRSRDLGSDREARPPIPFTISGMSERQHVAGAPPGAEARMSV
jgi:hypothetical protein